MLCKKCGAQIPDDIAKCPFCGEKFYEDEPITEEQTTIDENVENKEVSDETRVVDINSEALESSDNTEASYADDMSKRSTHDIFEENEKKRKQQFEKVVDEKQQQLDEITERRNQKKLKQKRNRIILITLLCVLLAGAAGFSSYVIKNGGFNTNSVIVSPAPSTSPVPTLSPIETPAATSPSPSAGATEKPKDDKKDDKNSSSSDAKPTSGSSSGNSSSEKNTSSSGTSNSVSNSSGSGSSNSEASSSGKASSTVIDTNKYSGNVSDNINSKLVIGNTVVYDEPSNKYFMTFNMDGTMYYANVSAGSTTEQINGKYITIDAEPTNGRYDGNTVYEISSMTYYDGDFIIPDSGIRLISADEIKDFSKDKLGLARNEIYARHGRKFQMEVYQNYFSTKAWYKINPNYDYTDDNNNLNSVELENVSTILSIENTK